MNFDRLGQLALERREPQEAVNIFRRALEQGKAAGRYVGLGKAYLLADDAATARWAFYRAVELEPGNREALDHIERIEGTAPRTPPPQLRQCRFRVRGENLEVFAGSWRRFFVKGMNLGLGIPGFFPGEYPILKGTYLRWFEQIAELGANALRTYAVHPPSFYEALAQFNGTGKRLYLFQGIWMELPESGDFEEERYADYVREQIRNGVDAVFGAVELPERPGYPNGRYATDVSPWTAGFILGREWEPCAVRNFNDSRGGSTADFAGHFIKIAGGTPFERWIAGICDYLQEYEHRTFAVTHPVSVNNWPTLDPLRHPSESDHESELALQGITSHSRVCNENEDMATLDTAKIGARAGGGFFATYHVYPYYPDFMNNDYEGEPNPYLAYLAALQRHHAGQPVIIGEFGVPSSREVTHWQRNGWHHGGHSEKRQGEVNALLMETVHRTGMAGGILFSWFDEWFKRNWLFFPYEVPAERKPFWFNLQDAEENYGLLAAYPGYPDRLVTLTGVAEEWRDGTLLYEKESGPLARFGDGRDGGRTLRRLLVQHDEGFLYLRLETAGTIDFSHGHYLVGIDTCAPETGEFRLPCDAGMSPIGLKFVLHLAGREKSRILICRPYDRYLNKAREGIRPEMSSRGEWVVMQNRTNVRRISRDGRRFFPARVFPMGNLRCGSLDPKGRGYDSLADFNCGETWIEVRIPWGLISFADPSSRRVVWVDREGRARQTDGIRLIAVSYRPEAGRLTAMKNGEGKSSTDSLPARLDRKEVRTYSWDGWDTPVYHTYLKESYFACREAFARIREER